VFLAKLWETKNIDQNGDIAFAFKKFAESLKKFETLKLELQREAIKTTKFIA
jgi:hypothetical protein